MQLVDRIFQDLRNYLIQPEVIHHRLVTRWTCELLRSESQEIPFVEMREEYVKFEIIDLWKSLKKKVPEATAKKNLDRLIVLWAEKVFTRIQKDVEGAMKRTAHLKNLSATLTGSKEEIFTEVTSTDHIRLFEYIHSDLKQSLENDPSDTEPQPPVLTWLRLLRENFEQPNPMSIPEYSIDDGMLDVWMKMKVKFPDDETRDTIDKLWELYARMLAEKIKREKDRTKYLQSKSDATSFYRSILPTHHSQDLSLYVSQSEPFSVFGESPDSVSTASDLSPISTCNTPASVSSVSDVSPQSEGGSPDDRVIAIPLVDKLGTKIGVFQFARERGKYICRTGDCVNSYKKTKREGLIRSSLIDHARKEHSFKIDLRKKLGTKCKPLKCPICLVKFNRKQTLMQHLKNKKIHPHLQRIDGTTESYVSKAVEETEHDADMTNITQQQPDIPPLVSSILIMEADEGFPELNADDLNFLTDI